MGKKCERKHFFNVSLMNSLFFMTSNGLVTGEVRSFSDKSTGECHVLPHRGICTCSPPPQTSLITADSSHVSPSVDAVNATNTYLHSPLSCPTPGYEGQVWKCLTSGILLTFQGREKQNVGGKKVLQMEIEEERRK